MEEEAVQALLAGDYTKAVRLLEKVVGEAGDAMLYCNLAHAYLKLELYRRCIKQCDAALSLRGGKCLRASIIKAEALQAMKKTKHARHLLQQAMRDNPLEDIRLLQEAARLLSPPSATTSATPPEDVTPLAQRARHAAAAKQQSPLASPSQIKKPVQPLSASHRKGNRDSHATLQQQLVRDGGRSSGGAARNNKTKPKPKTSNTNNRRSTNSGDAKASGSVVQTNSSRQSSGAKQKSTVPGASEKPTLEEVARSLLAEVPTIASNMADDLVLRKRQKSTSELHSKTTSEIVAERGLVQFGVGDPRVDKQIAAGYLQVNTGQYDKGVALFSALLAKQPRAIGALLGRGTALAFKGNLRAAIADFTAALELDPKCVDALKRRGQSLAAGGEVSDALRDFRDAIRLKPDHEAYHQRGLIYYKQKNYRRAQESFALASQCNPAQKSTWNFLGLSLNSLGRTTDAMEAYHRAVALDPSYFEAWTNYAQSYKDNGEYERAEAFFSKALELNPSYAYGYNLRGLARFFAGRHPLAALDLGKAIELSANALDAKQILGVVYHGMGQFRHAAKWYGECLKEDSSHVTWYNLQMAFYIQGLLDKPWNSINFDHIFSPSFKECWCKRRPPTEVFDFKPTAQFTKGIADVKLSSRPFSEAAGVIFQTAQRLGPLIQLDCPGYLVNKRQHGMAGMAIISMSQRLAHFWSGERVTCDGGWSSKLHGVPHTFSWRDAFDIAVKWRQISEPNDPVWWVDMLTPAQFAEGFGSHTPLITGQCHVVRYFPMFSRLLEVMKMHVMKDPALSERVKQQVRQATTEAEIWACIRRDFWVTTPCLSSTREGVVLEGTRLTVQYVPPEGYEVSIRTPGTPVRQKRYEREFDNLWELLVRAVRAPERDVDRCSELILRIAFYWYNFMPLSRGSASVGYIWILAAHLSLGYEIAGPIPPLVQPDWEGVLTSDPQQFVDSISSWLYPLRKETTLLQDLPQVEKEIDTPRKVISMMNLF